jgi:hypothetical protein
MVECAVERAVEREAGTSLVELLVCVALLVAGTVVALGGLPALARSAQADVVRDVATGVARNAIERVRAAAAYAPPAQVADPASRAATVANHAWAIAPTASFASAARIRHPLCGGAGTNLDVPLQVSTTYDAAADRIAVSVAYPRDPCDPSSPTATIALAATLAPAQFAPQTLVPVPIADPARQ